jgi:hypothetical protein
MDDLRLLMQDSGGSLDPSFLLAHLNGNPNAQDLIKDIRVVAEQVQALEKVRSLDEQVKLKKALEHDAQEIYAEKQAHVAEEIKKLKIRIKKYEALVDKERAAVTGGGLNAISSQAKDSSVNMHAVAVAVFVPTKVHRLVFSPNDKVVIENKAVALWEAQASRDITKIKKAKAEMAVYTKQTKEEQKVFYDTRRENIAERINSGDESQLVTEQDIASIPPLTTNDVSLMGDTVVFSDEAEKQNEMLRQMKTQLKLDGDTEGLAKINKIMKDRGNVVAALKKEAKNKFLAERAATKTAEPQPERVGQPDSFRKSYLDENTALKEQTASAVNNLKNLVDKKIVTPVKDNNNIPRGGRIA